ncbi:MAG: carboxymuconolactone decarboxylase family protein [Peptococcaceae bacterium]|jgi:alkylhydroperoxidase/carboxymuconolactone decarboxylase family protein YurZ|nr:carboxymuconolactone decarboxylase family protein [Peptococcaceae bacterium]
MYVSTPEFFQLLRKENPQVAEAVRHLRSVISETNMLDEKTSNLIIIGAATAMRNAAALREHIQAALKCGATREEIVSTILLLTPALGIPNILFALPIAIQEMEN